MADVFTFTTPTPENFRDSFLRTINYGLVVRGIPNPNTGPNSDWYVIGQALGNELAPIAANGIISADAVNLDTATGQDLLDRCAVYKQFLRSASGSLGFVILNSSGTTTVPLDSQLTDPGGNRYQVTVGGSYANGALIPIAAIDTGAATNLAASTSLQWRTAPAGSAPTALVGPGGLTNGVDAENPEALRQRTLSIVGNPPNAANASFCTTLAINASPSVQFAFAYPAAEGPATIHIAVTAAPTTTNSSRVINSTLLTGTIIPYILGNLPERSWIVVTGTVDTPVDVAMGLSLPSAPTASPPGPGGGWLDGRPWPFMTVGDGFNNAAVTAVTSTTQLTIATANPPVANVSRVAWFNYSTRTLLKATVIAFTGTSGAYAITIDTPFTGIAVGDYIHPQSANGDQYIAGILAEFELMGPGEKTANATSLQRSFRHPPPASSAPYSLGPAMLGALTANFTEVASAAFMFRNDVNNSVSIAGPSGLLTPPVTDSLGSIENAPLIYIPRNIAFYPAL